MASSSVVIMSTKRYSTWGLTTKSTVDPVCLTAKSVRNKNSNAALLGGVLEARRKAQVSSSWQREVGIVPQSAYSEGQYTLTFKSGKTVTVSESLGEIGMRVWDCAALMSRWFEKGDFVRGKRILELGSGTGLLGFACAVLGAKHVVITDLQSILKTMERNVQVTQLQDVCVARALNWNDINAVDALKKEFGPFDMIVASDVLVFAGDAQLDGGGGLIQALTHLAEPETTEILMGCNKNRHGFLVGFYANPPTHLFDIQVVGKDEVDPEYYTELVMLYRMKLKRS